MRTAVADGCAMIASQPMRQSRMQVKGRRRTRGAEPGAFNLEVQSFLPDLQQAIPLTHQFCNLHTCRGTRGHMPNGLPYQGLCSLKRCWFGIAESVCDLVQQSVVGEQEIIRDHTLIIWSLPTLILEYFFGTRASNGKIEIDK